MLIGDATFGRQREFKYVYDLAEEWIKFSGYPFAFAVWAANKPIDTQFLKDFNSALEIGVNEREKVIASLPQRPDYDLKDYLMNRISYSYDAEKKQALKKFLELIVDINSN